MTRAEIKNMSGVTIEECRARNCVHVSQKRRARNCGFNCLFYRSIYAARDHEEDETEFVGFEEEN